MRKNKRGALEFSFTWIFAIIVGGFILFLAIYGVSKVMSIQKTSSDTESAVSLGVLTNPLESSFETSKRTTIKTPVESRIYTGCSDRSYFGKQIIKISQKTYGEWSTEGAEVSFSNKYIFSENPAQGKKFYLFSKSFDFPFKVADLIYLTSSEDKYCFVNFPRNIEKEIEELTGGENSETENLFAERNAEDCPAESKKVCYNGGRNCYAEVYENYVKKGGKIMDYAGDSLMYAAIFSNPADYECQLKRLMKRTGELSRIYIEKSNFVFLRTGCSSNLNVDLAVLRGFTENFEGSENIELIYNFAEDLSMKNKGAECRLW